MCKEIHETFIKIKIKCEGGQIEKPFIASRKSSRPRSKSIIAVDQEFNMSGQSKNDRPKFNPENAIKSLDGFVNGKSRPDPRFVLKRDEKKEGNEQYLLCEFSAITSLESSGMDLNEYATRVVMEVSGLSQRFLSDVSGQKRQVKFEKKPIYYRWIKVMAHAPDSAYSAVLKNTENKFPETAKRIETAKSIIKKVEESFKKNNCIT